MFSSYLQMSNEQADAIIIALFFLKIYWHRFEYYGKQFGNNCLGIAVWENTVWKQQLLINCFETLFTSHCFLNILMVQCTFHRKSECPHIMRFFRENPCSAAWIIGETHLPPAWNSAKVGLRFNYCNFHMCLKFT